MECKNVGVGCNWQVGWLENKQGTRETSDCNSFLKKKK